MNHKKSISQYDVIRELRFPMIVLVTYAHSYGNVADGFSLLASDWNTYEFLKLLISQILVKVAVPVFFIMSGYLFFVNIKEWNMQVYKAKILRRIKTLLIPYLVWNLLMALKLKTYSWSFFWEPVNMPLWFLRDLMLVILLTPIIYYGVRKLGYWLLILLIPVYLTGIWLIQPGVNPYGLCFFTLGAYLGIRKMELVNSVLYYEKSSYILTIMFGLVMLCTYHTSAFPPLMLCFRISGAITVFCLCYRVLSRTSRRIPDVISSSSYFIYLAHYVLFFSFIDEAFFSIFGFSTISLSVHYLLCPLLKVTILVVAYAAYHTIRGVFFQS